MNRSQEPGAAAAPAAPVRLEPHPEDERLAVLRIERPPLNAFDQAMWDLFAAVAASLHAGSAYRAVVITGGAAHFAAGADVKALTGLTPEEFNARNRVLQRAFHDLATAPQITIAAVNGYALGGGCELALAADFRFAGRGAVFGLPEITLGIIPGSGGTQRLPRLIGTARAKELILTGRLVRSDEALAIGLADRVVDDADVLDAAIAQGLAYARGPLALRYAKQAVDSAAELPAEAGLALEADLIATCFASEDGQHGLHSFVTDGPRKATFRGRLAARYLLTGWYKIYLTLLVFSRVLPRVLARVARPAHDGTAAVKLRLDRRLVDRLAEDAVQEDLAVETGEFRYAEGLVPGNPLVRVVVQVEKCQRRQVQVLHANLSLPLPVGEHASDVLLETAPLRTEPVTVLALQLTVLVQEDPHVIVAVDDLPEQGLRQQPKPDGKAHLKSDDHRRLGEQRIHHAVVDLREQLFLRPHVVIERAAGKTGGVTDFRDSGACVTVLREQPGGDIDQVLAHAVIPL